MPNIVSLNKYRECQSLCTKRKCWLYIYFISIDNDIQHKNIETYSKEQVLRKIAKWAFKFTPIISLDPPSGLLLDITGTERLFGPPELLSRKIYRLLVKNGFSIKVATAPTVGAAWAIARYSSSTNLSSKIAPQYPLESAHINITNTSREDYLDLLSQLPIQALRISPAICTKLHELGIRLIKDLLDIPRSAISQRFGINILKQIDLACGVQEEVVTTLQVEKEWGVNKLFDIPLNNITIITKVIVSLVGKLCEKLRHSHKTASIFLLELSGRSRIDTSHFKISKNFKLVSAVDDPKLITLLTTPFLENLKLPGSINQIFINAIDVQTGSERQITINGDSHAKYDLNELIHRLIGKFGQDQVKCIKMHESYLPEKSFSFESIQSLEELLSKSNSNNRDIPPYIPSNRPPVMLETPLEIGVIALLPDSIPAQIQIADITHKVVTGVGPEKIVTEWWNLAGKARDSISVEVVNSESNENLSLNIGTREYFKIQDEYGRWLWIFRSEESMQWFLHGLWP